MTVSPRKFSEADIEARVNWINNPLIHRTMYFNLPATIEQTREWYARLMSDDSRFDFTFVDEKGYPQAMGGLTGITSEHQNGEFYIMVNPQKHGLGIGQRASEWIYNFGFSVLNLHKIYLYTNSGNISAYKLYEKLGFVLEGILREHKHKDGAFQDRRLYGLLRTEWDLLPWKKNVKNVF